MRNVKKGQTLYLQGSADKSVYLLKEGAVKITKLNRQGKEIILDIFGAGSVFGEMAHAATGMRDEAAVVVEDGLVCTMDREFFEEAVRKMPELSMSVTKIIGLRRHRIENKLLSLLYSTVEQRLARTLVELLEEFGKPHEGGRMIGIKLTHKDLAELIASTRETVTAGLNRMKNEGLIEFDGKHVVVKSPDRLRALAL
jgi:CRP-like cAMP-binding protein